MTTPFTPEATRDAVRAGCSAADIHLHCAYPDCACKQMPAATLAIFSALAPHVTALIAAAKAEEWDKWMACASYVDTPRGRAYRGWNVTKLSALRMAIEDDAAIRQRGETERG